MPVLTFKYGKNLTESTPFIAGTLYLDIETGEMFYDDPTSNTIKHQKIVDTNTLLYWVEETVMSDGTIVPGTTLPPVGEGNGSSGGNNDQSNTSAKLGIAILGSMLLGTE
jgi:hypothetical protein